MLILRGMLATMSVATALAYTTVAYGQSTTPAPAQTSAQTSAVDSDPDYSFRDEIRTIPYKAFGPLFYTKTLNYPVSAPWFSYFHVTDHKIILRPSKPMNVGADESGWVPVPVKDGSVYFRAEYHLKDLADVSVENDIADAVATYRDSKTLNRTKTNWQPTADQQTDFKTRGKMHIVLYPTELFRAQFFPGTTILMQADGSMHGDQLSVARGGIKMKSSYSRVTKEYGAVAGVFKATFDNSDCIRDGRFPGLIVDGKTIDAPLQNLATFAVYADGSTRIAPYAKLPKDGVQMLRQNEFPLLDAGEINIAGAYPVRWNRFEDNIMRSYMFMSADGKYLGYVWTNYVHPSSLAKVIKKLGFSDLMLMDIHPAFAAGVRLPAKKGEVMPEFFGSGSYPLVPLESEVVNAQFSASARLITRGQGIQWNYKSAGSGTPNDFIGVFLK